MLNRKWRLCKPFYYQKLAFNEHYFEFEHNFLMYSLLSELAKNNKQFKLGKKVAHLDSVSMLLLTIYFWRVFFLVFKAKFEVGRYSRTSLYQEAWDQRGLSTGQLGTTRCP